VKVYIIALLSTISTAGYLAFFPLTITYFIKNKWKLYNPFYWAVLISFVIYIPRFYNESPFMRDKIETYIERGTDTWEHESGITRVSRLGVAMITLDYSLRWPFGNGILVNQYQLQKYGDVGGPNSLAQILHEWGWIGLFLFYYFFYKYYRFMSREKFLPFLFLISVSIVLFSNPFYFKYLIYTFIFYSMLFCAHPRIFTK